MCVCFCVWGLPFAEAKKSVGPPHKCSHLNWVWPSIFRLEKKENGNTKARGEKSIVTQQKCSTWKGEFIALHFHFSLYRLSLSPSFFLSQLIWKWEEKAAGLCVSVCAGILQFNVVSVPCAWGSFQRVRQPVVMTLYGEMAQREQSHLHWHFCHHLWLCQQAWSLHPLLEAHSGWVLAITHRSTKKWTKKITINIFFKG